MSKFNALPLLLAVSLLASGCVRDQHIGMWINEEGRVPDADQDGVTDDMDRCPKTPVDMLVDQYGCPNDDDRDGVTNQIDLCPNTLAEAPVDEYGCPNDDDRDGVINQIDRCPDTPLETAVDELGCAVDSDGDGVLNDNDQCPDTPQNTQVDARGCTLDGDGDGVADSHDRCPDTPEGETVDRQGCTDLAKSMPALSGLYFALDSARLRPEALPVLDRVVALLNQRPDVKVLIVGHTDSRGSDRHNLDLSRRRARAVYGYLVEQGVSADRLAFAGKGERSPVAPNDTKEGRARNRRVEFIVQK